MKTDSGLDRQSLAKKGEDVAEAYFRNKKFEILTRNYRSKLGEMDLIVRKGAKMVFVEVKTRSSRLFGEPEESVNAAKKRKLRQVAECYLKEKGWPNLDFQFDVLSLVFSRETGSFQVSHIENAFDL